ncbi:citrate-binding protein-like [Nicotiana tabacum]|uniref:Citrate-binding protein-like n=1 Tax=Nicotiana tabacum TaxID=4097 RepID=A0A1S4B4A1_TOBAC|nr:PREDICTED: citrate-binding protein-like [Nicotiana tabacum]
MALISSPHLPLILFTLLQLIVIQNHLCCKADPTDGFTSVTLSESNFQIQKPYDVAVNQRYSFINGVHKMWVFKTDKPHTPTSQTKPRTEIRITGRDYSSGVWQFEAYGYIPSGTTGVSIMQIFGASTSATTLIFPILTLMLRDYNGDLTYYRTTIEPNIYNRWFRLNVIHDVGASKLKVYINGNLKYEASGRGGDHHYFKFGVYGQDNESDRMESRWRGIKLFRK